MKVAVQHGKETYDLTCRQDETIGKLMDKIQEASGIATRSQKIIHKGKTLDAKATLAQAKMKEGAKLMLIASSTPAQTQVCLVRVEELTWYGALPIILWFRVTSNCHLLMFIDVGIRP